MVRPGRYGQLITHYNVLSTIEDAYGVPRIGSAATSGRVTGVWKSRLPACGSGVEVRRRR